MKNKIGTVGRFLPGLQYRLAPIPGMSEGGVLSVFGPTVMKGYLLADKPYELVSYENKWYDTGDIVSIDEEGFITIKGRLKRFAKIAGEMVSLTMIENYIRKLWPEHQHAVINIAEEKKGEQLVLITTYSEAAREPLVIFAKENLMSEITIPKQIHVLAKMPLLGSGKIDYVFLHQYIHTMI
jgi:acyl-[acyl-carrier-protein]-phospholipid O-acyltransferase/long-chain-fatty-acid--[acyl-carrier-protein] ligase